MATIGSWSTGQIEKMALTEELRDLKLEYALKCEELIRSQGIVRTLTTHINELYVLINNMQSKGKE